jgi:hypothetical protein
MQFLKSWLAGGEAARGVDQGFEEGLDNSEVNRVLPSYRLIKLARSK